MKKRFFTKSCLVFAFFLVVLSADAHGAAAPCTEPEHLKEKEKAPKLECEGLEKLAVYNCLDAKKAMEASISSYRAKIKSPCATAAKTCTQKSCMAARAAETERARKDIEALKADLAKKRNDITEAKKKIKNELESPKLVEKTTHSPENGKSWHGDKFPKKKEDLETGRKTLRETFATISGRIDPSGTASVRKSESDDKVDQSALLGEAVRAIDAMSAFQREIDQETKRLDDLSKKFKANSDSLASRATDMGPVKEGAKEGGPANPPPGQQAKPAEQAGGSPAGGGGSPAGGGSPEGSPSTLSDAAYPDENGTSPTAASVKADQTADKSEKIGSQSEKLAEPLSIEPGKSAAPLTAGSGEFAGSTASSNSTGSSNGGFSSRLRAALAAKADSLESGGSSMAGSGGEKNDKEGKSAAVSSGGSSGGSGGGGGGGDYGGSDDVLSPFGKPLSDPKFSLAGSETDSSVKNMMEDFGEGEEEEGNRDPASDVADGIGERNGPSLFERAKVYHDRCAERGCVTAARRKQTVGG